MTGHATRDALNAVWNDLLTDQEIERQRVAGMLNALSGLSRSRATGLAELDQGLRGLIRDSERINDPAMIYPQGGPVPPRVDQERVAALAREIGEPDAQHYLNRLDTARV